MISRTAKEIAGSGSGAGAPPARDPSELPTLEASPRTLGSELPTVRR